MRLVYRRRILCSYFAHIETWKKFFRKRIIGASETGIFYEEKFTDHTDDETFDVPRHTTCTGIGRETPAKQYSATMCLNSSGLLFALRFHNPTLFARCPTRT